MFVFEMHGQWNGYELNNGQWYNFRFLCFSFYIFFLFRNIGQKDYICFILLRMYSCTNTYKRHVLSGGTEKTEITLLI